VHKGSMTPRHLHASIVEGEAFPADNTAKGVLRGSSGELSVESDD
jgi:hypothetical protein